MEEFNQFFKDFTEEQQENILNGITRQQPLHKVFENAEEFNKLLDNATEVFSKWDSEDIDRFESISDKHIIFLHFVGGYRPTEFLEATTR